MSQRMRDLRKKIINVKLRSPNKTHQEIADECWVKLKTVKDTLNASPYLKMTEEERKNDVALRAYHEIIDDITDITRDQIKKFKESKEEFRTSELKDLSAIAKDTLERQNLLEGKPTENQNITINFN